MVSTWRGDTQNDLSALLHALEIIIPLSLLLSAAGGYLLARRTLAPLTSMAQTVDSISSARLDRRIEILIPRDELGQLALRFNRLLDRLQEAFEQQRRFMADASHELRTPLSAALTATQVMLREKNRSAEEYREALQIVGEQLRRLRRIVEDMFLLARADTASLEIRREEFYLDELVVESCRAMRLLAERNGVKLKLLQPLPEIRMWGDAGLIRQAIIILLDNACKYTSAGGSVCISLDVQADSCTLRVSDTGPGIPEFAQPYLFERFYQVDSSRSRLQARAGEASSGAGLGLAIARWIAEQHGSRVFLESSSPAGSVFAFQLTIPVSFGRNLVDLPVDTGHSTVAE
jgi:heavy metal sensor kinase